MCMKKLMFLLLFILPILCFSQKGTNGKKQEIVEGESIRIEVYVDSPQFPGGYQELLKFLNKNLKYPRKALIAKKEGKVFVEFFVDTNGNILNPKIVRSDSYLFDQEAIRLVKMMPKWVHFKIGGVPFRDKVTIPINFKLKNNYN